jgi:hypothetical protein
MSKGTVWTPDMYIHPVVEISFNPRAFDCAHCPMLETYARKQCRLTGEYVLIDTSIGTFCPLCLSKEDKEKILNYN